MFLFAHLEKCGGTSVHQYLKTRINNYLVLRPNPDHGDLFNKYQLNFFRKNFKKIDGFGGHRIRLYENYDDVDTYFTILRNPIDRYLSHLRHQIERNILINPNDFLDDSYFDNFLCKRISGVSNADACIEIIHNKNVYVNILENDLSKIKVLNKALKSYKFPQIDMKKILEKNLEDIKLYDYCNNVYKNKINLDNNKAIKKLSLLEEKFFFQRIMQEIAFQKHGNKNNYLKRGK